jgi:hypothetical protein
VPSRRLVGRTSRAEAAALRCAPFNFQFARDPTRRVTRSWLGKRCATDRYLAREIDGWNTADFSAQDSNARNPLAPAREARDAARGSH